MPSLSFPKGAWAASASGLRGLTPVGVGIMVARDPSTDPDWRLSRIRLLPQVITPSRLRGYG